ncbi:MAG: Asp23/Gls24 family envelope stress response protein [Lachnospiraceae bacterium]|nr:Asp23/Gls24 family envelope stress response protein [Lachnospiraceae bacterium]
MADKRTMFTIREDEQNGSVKVSEEVLAIIAGLAATEVKGVSSMAGGFKEDTIARLGLKNLRAGVSVTVEEDHITAIDLALNINYGFSIVDVSREVQERVKNAVESMTGLEVSQVNVRVADVSMKDNQE